MILFIFTVHLYSKLNSRIKNNFRLQWKHLHKRIAQTFLILSFKFSAQYYLMSNIYSIVITKIWHARLQKY